MQVERFFPFIVGTHLEDNVTFHLVEEKAYPCFANEQSVFHTHTLDSRIKVNNDIPIFEPCAQEKKAYHLGKDC